MLTTNTLMNAVEAALKRLYPGEPVYYDAPCSTTSRLRTRVEWYSFPAKESR